MLKALMKTEDGRQIAVFGITGENAARLFSNEPIKIDTAADPPHGLGIEGGPIVLIIGGSNEDKMAATLLAAVNTTDTKFYDDRP